MKPQDRRLSRIDRALAAIAVATLGVALAAPVHAEGRLRIAQQFGVVYLLLNVVQDQALVEKHARAEGFDVKVEFVQLSGGANINDALLSGSIDVAAAGVGPLLTVWDRTFGRQNVRGIASLGSLPYELVSNHPAVRTIADFTAKDRIALPAVGVSVQSRLLQFASAKRWGDAQFNRLDLNQVAVPHPEATAAVVKGGTEITAHFGSPPFQEQELAGNPAAHVVLDSYEVLGGPASATVLYGTERFRQENPRTYRAFTGALAEAAQLVKRDPDRAADIFIRVTHSGIDRGLLLKIIKDPKVDYTLTPQRTLPLATFMHRIGAIRHAPAAAKDYFFDDAHNAGAN